MSIYNICGLHKVHNLSNDWLIGLIHLKESTTLPEACIYLTVLNLPRRLGFKDENSILVGVIPGPKESSLSINFHPAPLVQELDMLSTCMCDHATR